MARERGAFPLKQTRGAVPGAMPLWAGSRGGRGSADADWPWRRTNMANDGCEVLVLQLRRTAGGQALRLVSMPGALSILPSTSAPSPSSRSRTHLHSSPWSSPRILSFAAWSLVALLLST